MTKLWQNIDTLKIHLYTNNQLDIKKIKNYNTLLSDLVDMKKEAQKAKNEYENFKKYQKKFGYDYFQILPSSVSGFLVTIKNSDISVHFKKVTSLLDNSPFIKVEFRSSFLHRYGYLNAIKKVNSFLQKYIISNYTIKVSEIHLQVDIQGYSFNVLDFHRFKSRARNNKYYDEHSNDNVYYSGREFQGLSLGSGNYMMRIYNKSKEIIKFPNKSYIQELWALNKNYDENKDVFRIEFQLRREKLKTMVINDCVLDGFAVILNNINNIWQKCLEDFQMLDLSSNCCLELLQGFKINSKNQQIALSKEAVYKRIQRADIHPLWKLINTFNGHKQTEIIQTFKKPFNPAFLYVHNAYKAYLSTLLSHYNTINQDVMVDSFTKIKEYTEKKHKVSILEDVLSKRLDKFNKLEVLNTEDEKLLEHKEYFLHICEDVFKRQYSDMYFQDVNLSFFEKLQKVC